MLPLSTIVVSAQLLLPLESLGIYGENIAGGIPPTDLDICNGRTGVTPDSNGEDVYCVLTLHNSLAAVLRFLADACESSSQTT